jgi:eukaryotic-like serine/threonine-protein kinase
MTKLAGRYELGPQIERGGMAIVYRATDTVLNREVAVKVLAGALARDEGFVRRFEREARNVARLSHPNVVQVFDAGSEDDTHFMVMELVEGTTLAEVIEREAPVPADRAARIAADVAEALGAAHAKEIVHRDVKPANVLLTANGTVKVADFGIARAADSARITQTGTLLGTAAYVSPEQAVGMPATPRSDIYSLGCVLFEMLTGRPPFTAETPVAMLQRHLNDPVSPPSSQASVPEALDRLVVACLAKDPSSRPPSASDLRRDLLAATVPDRPGDTMVMEVAEEPTLPVAAPGAPPAPPPMPVTAPGPPWWSRPGAILLGGLLLVAALVLLILSATDGGGRGDARTAGDGRGPGPSTSAKPSTQTSTPASSPSAAGIQAAYTSLIAGIKEEAANGGLEDKAAKDLLHRAEDIGEKLEEGKYEEVAGKIGEFGDKLQEQVEKDEVSSASAEVLQERLRLLVQAILVELRAGDVDDEDG